MTLQDFISQKLFFQVSRNFSPQFPYVFSKICYISVQNFLQSFLKFLMKFSKLFYKVVNLNLFTQFSKILNLFSNFLWRFLSSDPTQVQTQVVWPIVLYLLIITPGRLFIIAPFTQGHDAAQPQLQCNAMIYVFLLIIFLHRCTSCPGTRRYQNFTEFSKTFLIFIQNVIKFFLWNFLKIFTFLKIFCTIF